MDNNVLDDRIYLYEGVLRISKMQKAELEKHNEEIAGLMSALITDEAKEELAKITQINYKEMIELEIKLAELEQSLKAMKGLRFLM